MAFGKWHQWLTSLVVVLGLLALLTSMPRHAIASPLGVVVLGLVIPQVVLAVLRRSARWDGILFVLVALHVVVSSLLAPGIVWGLCVVGILAVVPGALVLSLLRREVENNYRSGARDRTGMPVDVRRILRSRRVVGRPFALAAASLVVPLGAFAVAFFVACPHFSLSLFRLEPALRGLASPSFADRPANNDDSVVARFELAGDNERASVLPLRLRVEAFDTWDGKAWVQKTGALAKSTVVANKHVVLQRRPNDDDRLLLLDVDGLDVLPFPDRAVAIDAPSTEVPHFAIWMGDGRGVATGARNDALLAVPPTFSARARGLAHAWADSHATNESKARAIEAHLRTELGYDLDPPSRMSAAPLDDFLFESRRGHCLYFATSMILMLREVGVPSRLVSGFAGATYNPYGHYYAVRGRDAHAWVEADIGGVWRAFDPTPTGQAPRATAGTFVAARAMTDALERRWATDVVHMSTRGVLGWHVSLRRTASKMWRPLALVFVSALAAWALSRGRDRRRSSSGGLGAGAAAPAIELYASLEGALRKRGLRRSADIPPERFSRDLTTAGHPLAEEIASLTRLYLEARFGGRPLSPEERADYHARVAALVPKG